MRGVKKLENHYQVLKLEAENNCFLIDWLTFVAHGDTVEYLKWLLGLDGADIPWEVEQKFRNGYPMQCYWNGITISYGADDPAFYKDSSKVRYDMGICVNLSGTGCRAFETYGNGDWLRLFTYLFREQENTWQGHLINSSVKALGKLPAKRALNHYDFGDVCWEYLDKIRLLCQENGTELILMKAPSVYPYWYDEYEQQIRSYAEEHGLSYYNFLECAEQIGIDYQTDTYDGGLHLNLAGATKLSKYFAEILSQNHNLPDHRGNAPEFDQKLSEYDKIVTVGG